MSIALEWEIENCRGQHIGQEQEEEAGAGRIDMLIDREERILESFFSCVSILQYFDRSFGELLGNNGQTDNMMLVRFSSVGSLHI